MKDNLLCFSHLRWNFVYQRPQHLMSRFAQFNKVYFLEEPVFDSARPGLTLSPVSDNLRVLVPHLPSGLSKQAVNEILRRLLDNFLQNEVVSDFTFWYYTPMALEFSGHYHPGMVVYDCMDELSAFDFAPRELKQLERNLMDRADVMFTGGHSLFEAKKDQHEHIFPFPSSIDKDHFTLARTNAVKYDDQECIPGPRLGFCGVIDERFDLELIREISARRPDWNLVLIGPVVKIDHSLLPQAANIHYLGQKTYEELPSYMSGWDIALIPFLLNRSTRFISPTKTPEYLAAGIPVVSTPVKDVVDSYGKSKLVRIGATGAEFISNIEAELADTDKAQWLSRVDAALSTNSWDKTFFAMQSVIQRRRAEKSEIPIAS